MFMMKKRLFPLLAYMLAFALMFTTVGVFNTSYASADDVDAEDEEDEEDEEDDEDLEGLGDVANFDAVSISKDKATLKWDKVEDADGYEIQYKLDKKGANWCDPITVTKARYEVKKLSPGKKYVFRIRAFIYYEEDLDDEEEEEEVDDGLTYEDAEEDDEDSEDEEIDDYDYGEYTTLKFTTLDRQGKGQTSTVTVKPAMIKKISYSKSSKKVTLKWKQVSNADGYIIQVATKKDGKYKTVTTLKTNKKTQFQKAYKQGKKDAKYYFQIIAYKGSGKNRVCAKASPAKAVTVPKKKK